MMNKIAILMFAASLIAFSGCGRKPENQVAQAALEQRDPMVQVDEGGNSQTAGRSIAFGGDLRESARNIPHRQLAAAEAILEPDERLVDLRPGERGELAAAADRFLVENIPDFAIKDAQRPWLDRQYLPVSLRLSRDSAGGIQAELAMRVLQWDEGEPVEADRIALLLEWTGGQWNLLDAPAQFRNDQANAIQTLQGVWQPGERDLPISE